MSTPHELRIELVDVDALIPDPQNARKHGKRNLDAIKASLERFGQRRPLVVTAAGVVIAGNGTLEAAKALGWSQVAIARTPGSWTDDEAKAYALADNRTAELAEWDTALLAEQLGELDSAGWDVRGLGFDLTDMEGNPDVIEDDVPEPPTETRTRPGQLWQLGEHRLMVGDSTDPEDFELLMGGRLAACIFTDPPYNVAYVGKTKEELVIENDAMSDDDFEKFLSAAYARMFDATMPGAAIYVCHSDTGGGVFRRTFVDAGFLLKQVLVWVKNVFVMGRQDYHWQHEPILYGWKPGAPHRWFGSRTKATVFDDEVDVAALKKADLVEIIQEARNFSTVIREDKPHRNAEHPTMKPVRLVARMLANSTIPGDIVLDPFGGSGSTLIAATQLKRTCYTMEMDPRYADVIIQRWETITGEEATRVDG